MWSDINERVKDIYSPLSCRNLIRLLQKSYKKEKNILNTIKATMTRQRHGLYTLNIIILNIRKIYLHKRRFVEKEKKV